MAFLLKIDVLCFLYVTILSIIFHYIPSSTIGVFACFLSLPSFIIIPYLFGKSVIMSLDKFLWKLGLFPSDLFSLFIFSWILGSYLAGTLAGLLTLIHFPVLVKNLSFLILAFSGLTIAYKWLKKDTSKNVFRVNIKIPLLVLFIIFMASTPVIIIKFYRPFPQALLKNIHMDSLWVQTAYRMLCSGYLEPEIRWPNTLFPYITLSLFRVEPLHFLWSAPFALAVIFAFGLFSFSYALSKKTEVALLSVLFGMFINIHVGWPGQFILHFKDCQILYAIFPFVLYSIYKKTIEIESRPIMHFKGLALLSAILFSTFIALEKVYVLVSDPNWQYFCVSVIKPISMVILPFLGIFASLRLKDRVRRGLFLLIFMYSITFYFWHSEEALLYTLVMLLFVFICDIVQDKRGRSFVWALAFTAFIYIYMQWIGIFHVPNIPISGIWNPQIVRADIDVFNVKRICFNFANRAILRVLMVIGGVFTLTSKKRENLIAVAMLAATLLIYFSPEYHTIRAYKEYSPFMAYILSFSIYSIYQRLNVFQLKSRPKLNRVLSTLMIVLIVVSILPILDDPLQEACSRWSSSEYVADYEYKTANWIKENLPENTLVVSDYRTMLLMDSLGNKIWVTGKGMHAQSLGSNESKQAINIIKYEIFKANSSEKVYLSVQKLPALIHVQERSYLSYTGIVSNDLGMIIIVSSRTVKWIEQEGIDDVMDAQYSKVDPKYIEIFENATYFELIYNVDETLYIFRVKR